MRDPDRLARHPYNHRRRPVRVGRLPPTFFAGATMKAIFSVALVLGLCGVASARDDKKADPAGTWKCQYKIGDMKRTSTLVIKKDGDKLTGTMTYQDKQEAKP